MEREKKIDKLAKSLYKGGFSTSESSALEKAKEMVETEEKIKDSQEKKGFFKGLKEKLIHKKEEEAPVKLDNYDINSDDRTVSEIMEEAGVDGAELNKPNKKEELKEEVEELKKEIEEEKKEPHPGKIEEIKKKEKEIKEDLETLEEEEGERIDIE